MDSSRVSGPFDVHILFNHFIFNPRSYLYSIPEATYHPEAFSSYLFLIFLHQFQTPLSLKYFQFSCCISILFQEMPLQHLRRSFVPYYHPEAIPDRIYLLSLALLCIHKFKRERTRETTCICGTLP